MQPAVAMTTDPETHGQTVRSAARRLSFIDEAASASAWIDECRRLLADGAVVIGLRSVDAEGDGLANAIAAGLGPEATRRLPASRDGAVTLDGDIGAVVILGADADAISVALLEHIDAVGLTLLAPRTARFWSNLPLYLISIPKAGTHLLFQLAEALGYKPGGPTPQSPTGGYWYYLLNTNAHTGADEFFHDELQRAPFGNRAHPFMRSPALFNYRHPLDILVSEASYFHLDGKSPLAIMLSTLSFEERIDRLIDDPWLLGTLRDRVGRFAAWLDCANVAPVSFEEMVGSPGGGSDAVLERLIWSLQLKLHIPGDPAAVRASVQKRDSATFREGRIGGWRDKLSPSALAKVRALPQDFMTRFGYDLDAVRLYPTQMETRLRRAISLSKSDYTNTPILVSTGVLQNNIILYRGKYYAVPMSWGPTELTRFSEPELEDLPHGQSEIAAVSAILAASIGIKDHRTTGSTPLFSLGEFNIIQCGHTFYGVHQRLGPVDVRLGPDRLREHYGPDDLVIANSPSAVIAELTWHEITEIWQTLGKLSENQLKLEQQGKSGSQLSNQIASLVAETRHRTEALHDQLQGKSEGTFLGHRIYHQSDRWLAVPRTGTGVSLNDPDALAAAGAIFSGTRTTLAMRLLASAAWHWLRWAYWDGARL